MSNLKNPNNLGMLKNEIKKLTSEYENFLVKLADSNQHKAANLYYWLKDYKIMLKREENFDPFFLKKYSRGDIVKVNLGFNIGSEQGGLHYAIVVEDNPRSSGIVTVVPMKSIKNNSPPKYYELNLGKEFMKAVEDKAISLVKEGLEFIDKYSKSDKQEDFMRQVHERDDLILKMTGCANQIKNMKSGSIALIKQITTISKMRIIDPVKDNDVLSGIRLSAETLSEIDRKITEFFTK